MSKMIDGKILGWLTIFLKEKELWDEFKIEFSRHTNSTIAEYFIGASYDCDAIDTAFIFKDTSHGYLFWQGISIEWRDFLSNKNKLCK